MFTMKKTYQKYNSVAQTINECDVCSEVITSPLCPFCLLIEVNAWLTLYPNLRKELLPKLYNYLNDVSNRITCYGTSCIKCKEKRAFVCPRCFTEVVFRELHKLQAGSLVLKEFVTFFNFASRSVPSSRQRPSYLQNDDEDFS